jgi:hypothetical protein
MQQMLSASELPEADMMSRTAKLNLQTNTDAITTIRGIELQ